VAKILKSRDVRLKQGDEALILRTVPFVRDGAKTTLELADAVMFVLRSRPMDIPEKVRGQLDAEMLGRIGRLRAALATVGDWGFDPLAAALRAFADAEGVGMGKFGPQLRAILAGSAAAPDLAGTMTALGRDESLARIDDALSLPA
jgi:glutamyl-tRNA synthetase